MSLRETQNIFSDALLSTNWQDAEHPAEKLVRSGGSMSARQRLEIYRSTGLTAQINALKQIYPVCEQIVGTRTFAELAHKYAVTHQSLSPDLNVYGESFAEFIQQRQQQEEFKDYYYLHDLCALEWLWHIAYYAEDDVVFDFNDFQQASEKDEDIIFNLSHSLTIMKTKYPIHLIWQQHRQQKSTSSVIALQQAEYLCIYREQFHPKIEKISQHDFDFFQACINGMSLQYLSTQEKYNAAMQAIPSFIQRGWICSFSLE